MTNDPHCPPPPYTPSDPLTPTTAPSPESALRLRGGDGEIPPYSTSAAEGHVLEGSPTYDDNNAGFSSAAGYFEERGLRIGTHEDVTLHQLFLSPTDRAEDVARIPLCWRHRSDDLTQADMSTFANFLLPPDANTRMPPKLRADLATDQKVPLSPTDTESDAERRARMVLVIHEWNERFFGPRGLLVELLFVPRHPPHAARGLDPICKSCVAANNSASRYAAQAYYQTVPPPMPHGMDMSQPPLPAMLHGHAMFPHGFPPVPPVPPMPHVPGVFHHDVPPHAPYGRMPFGFGYLRGGIERLASARGRSRGRGCDERSAGRGGLNSHSHGHWPAHHHRPSRSSRSSSSSSSSSSKSDHDWRHSSLHTAGDRGPRRGRRCAEIRGRCHERHNRRRGRSSSTSSSSSSDSDLSIGSISARDMRGLGLQAIISGIAAAKLGREGEKFGLKMEKMGKKLGATVENVGNKVDAKLAVKELKTSVKEMKRENSTNWKKELKELKKDLKQHMKEAKRERKGVNREAKERRREAKRNERERGRCGGTGTRGRECTEQREWDTTGIARVDAEGKVSGVTLI